MTPEFYALIAPDIDDIALGLRVLDAKLRDMRGALEARHPSVLRHAARDVSRVAGQVGALSDSLAARGS